MASLVVLEWPERHVVAAECDDCDDDDGARLVAVAVRTMETLKNVEPLRKDRIDMADTCWRFVVEIFVAILGLIVLRRW